MITIRKMKSSLNDYSGYKNEVILISDNWDDYSYRTTFYLKYIGADGMICFESCVQIYCELMERKQRCLAILMLFLLIILIKSYEDDEYVWIDYEDTGAGLIESYKKNPAKILEAFETSKRDVDGELVGTGMGMWIVNNTVLDYKGKIDLSKNLETKKGFYVTISLRK